MSSFTSCSSLRIIAFAALMAGGCSDGGTTETPTPGEPTAESDAGTADTMAANTNDSGGGDAAPVRVQPCNPIIQSNCAEGENCIFTSDQGLGTECIPGGTKAYGEACSGTPDCQYGLCLQLQDTDGSYCYQYCKISAHCGGDATCIQLSETDYSVCEITDIQEEAQSCQLLLQNCDPGQGCYPDDDGPICKTAGDSPEGETCNSDSDCVPGHTCVNHTCYKYCDKTKPIEEECGSLTSQCSGPGSYIGYCE